MKNFKDLNKVETPQLSMSFENPEIIPTQTEKIDGRLPKGLIQPERKHYLKIILDPIIAILI